MTDRVIINLANNKGNYRKGQNRLENTLREKGYTGDILFFQNEGEINAPLHRDNPYAFKLYAFNRAIQLGYKKILWLDASVFAVDNADKAFDIIEKDGYIMQYAGYMASQWCNDKSLNYFGISRDEAESIPLYGNAGLLGFDLNYDNSYVFLARWYDAMKNGMFKGEWTNNNKTESNDPRCHGHRHDLSVGSLIAYQLGMKYNIQGNEFLIYAGKDRPVKQGDVFYAKGM